MHAPTHTITDALSPVARAVPFISKWRTTSAGESVTLPLESGGTYYFTIDWGDGSATETVTTSWCSHAYATAGEHNITMAGTIEGFRFNNGGVRSFLPPSLNWLKIALVAA